MDFRTSNGIPTQAQAPIYTRIIALAYQFGYSPSAVKLQLSTGDILSLPLAANATGGTFSWYTFESTYTDPNVTPRGPMPPGLKAELKDGVLSARLWADGPSNGASDSFSVSALGFGYRLDITDLGSLAAHYGTTSGAVFEDGNLDGDEDVDLSDLGTLASYHPAGQAQAYADFEALDSGAHGQAVPEPSCVLMMACAALAIRRQHKRSGPPRLISDTGSA
jgi:hypothetical protein